MKTTKIAKLALARETIKHLDRAHLGAAVGGRPAEYTSPYYTYCECKTWEGCPK